MNVIVVIGLLIVLTLIAVKATSGYFASKYQTCTFDRNEPGPLNAEGQQWWWEIYKCPDGTERRVLVAGPRG